jgi:hypothetical protein
MPRVAIGLSFVLVLGVALWLLVTQLGCGMADPNGKAKEAFAADRPAPDPFDADRAMGYLKAVCDIGTRVSGSDGMKKQQELLTKHFEGLGAKVTRQEFTATQRSEGREVAMANLVASWQPDKERRVILCSHYDSRPHADQETDPRKREQPFLSANDGGSGVALLMELGHAMKDLDAKVGVDFVFFDGEEYVFNERDQYFFGSTHFAKQYREGKGKTRYVGAVLLDMVGGKDAHFPVEKYSFWKAPQLTQDVWRTAEELHCGAFLSGELSKVEVRDDHVPLNQGGIPAVDIIDFDYPHWHKLTDLPENCSGDTLEQVARVLSVWVQRVQ